jgi:hypothetical protein
MTALSAPCEASGEESFREVFGRLIDYVRTRRTKIGEDELVGSDIILPPVDVSLPRRRRSSRARA